MKAKKLTIQHVINNDLKGRQKNGDLKSVYIQISYNRKNNKLKSNAIGLINIEDFAKIESSAKAVREREIIQQVMEIETNYLTQPLDSFDGFREKLKLYLKPIDEIYKEYGLKIVSNILLGEPEMPAEEQSILDELNEFLPFKRYLDIEGEYYLKTCNNPNVFIDLVYGYIINKELKPEYKILNRLVEDIRYYYSGYNCVRDFIRSDFLTNKDHRLLIDWLADGLVKDFSLFLDDCKRLGNQHKDKTIEEIEIGLMHANHYRSLIKRNKDLSKL